MIECYTWTTPNGYKVPIMLEEAEIPYELKLVDIGSGEQHTDSYRKINPNEKIPAIIDTEGADGRPLTIFESGAVLWYLAERSGKFLSSDQGLRYQTLSWLFLQVGSVGPMMGQLGHFRGTTERIPYALNRYTMETMRLLGVLNRTLEEREYLLGEYSIADMAMWPWIRRASGMDVSVEMYPYVSEWIEKIAERPAVIRAIEKVRNAKDEYSR